MTTFVIKLAGIPIEISASMDSTKEYCKMFLTEEKPRFTAVIEPWHMDMIRKQDRENALANGQTPPQYEDKIVEPLALCHAVSEILLHSGALLFHGSVVAKDGNAYLFTADSGTGKTTHCNLWLKNIPGSYILNGDKPLLLFKDGGVYACGSPWMGKEQYGVNEILPLAAVCILERDDSNHIEEITLKDGLETLIAQCHIPDGNGNILAVFNLMKQVSSVKLYRLGCNMDDEAAFVSYKTMVKNGNERQLPPTNNLSFLSPLSQYE